MQVSLKVRRFDPEASPEDRVRWDEYPVTIESNTTVLDALIRVREEMDGTLALRCSCRASICGSCGMRVNGRGRLACKTRIAEIVPEDGQLTIEPMGNQPVIKDLVISLDSFFAKVRQVDPYLQPENLPVSGEFIAQGEAMTNLLTAMNCIMCGVCVSDCTVLEVDSKFIGPAALAKAWRFVEDPRDGRRDDRLKKLNNEKGGIWDCTRCLQCVEVCPKGVAPMDRIMEMRDAAIEAGNRGTPGYRHSESFYGSIKRNGRLDETRLALESAGFTNIPRLLDLAPIGSRAALKRKLPPIIPHKAAEHQKIKDIYKRVEEETR